MTSSVFMCYVNGKKIEDDHVDPEWNVLYYLRNKRTKMGCSEGGCGACTVMISKVDRNNNNNQIKHFSANACLMPICYVHGLAITTVEGIGNAKSLHPIQERLHKFHGSQCGFCTPGIVMSMYALLRNRIEPTLEEIETTLQGNLCRCTGYRPILQGMQTFSPSSCCLGRNGNKKCCQTISNGTSNQTTECNGNLANDANNENQFLPYDPSQEPIFPPELQISDACDKELLTFKGDRVTWYRPTTLKELLKLKEEHPDGAKLTAGHTEIGIEMKFKDKHYPVLIALNAVPELNTVVWKDHGIEFGASTSLTQLEETLAEAIAKEPEYKTRVFVAIAEMVKMFAGQQIRNVASIAGNVVTASPIADLNPLLVASHAELLVMSKDTNRTFKMDKEFYCGYRQTQLKENEILIAITIPYSSKDEFFYGFKQSQRRTDDLAIVNAGMRVTFLPKTNDVQDIDLVFGGMSNRTITATKTETTLKGKSWNEQLLQSACSTLISELDLDMDAPGGMVKFRRTLVEKMDSKIPTRYQSATTSQAVDHFKASQLFEIVPSGQRVDDPIGRPIPHESGAFHSTGEAVYVDDIPLIENELHMALVLSTKAHAKIVSIDDSKAMAVKGVHMFLSAKDFPIGGNKTGIVIKDEEYCASQQVTCYGQIIGAIIANERVTAQKARDLVKIHYEELEPILTIEEAIEANSYYPNDTRPLTVSHGNVEEAMKTCHYVLNGEFRVGGQEHFYMETQSGQAIPRGEHDEITVTVACQTLYQVQMYVASALGIPEHKVVVKTKRLGGAFGGKETRAPIFAVIAALAAQKLQRPVRYVLDRDEDMTCTGGRHPFLIKFKVGFTNNGKLNALQCTAYNNGGHVLDLSAEVLDTFMKKLDNAFKIPNLDFTGIICKTNLPTNTAYRGFGAPQAMVFMQTMFSDIATYLNQDPVKVREINLYDEGETTFIGQVLTHCTLKKCWSQCLEMSQYQQRRNAVDQFNKSNRWKKRGIVIVPMKYGVGFIVELMNQAGALVHIYTDGTVLVSHGGVEMGQGLHTKLIQVASRVLKLASFKIHVMDTSTDRIPNAVTSAGSMSSDLFGGAVKKACETLMERLEPIMAKNPKGTWEQWVQAAYADRINLSATGFYKTRKLDELGGGPYQYCSYGAACSEVEIDCLTGDHRVIRTDIVMDVGESLNPGVDIGQIEGAFMQGYGLFTLEELRYSPKGELITKGPSNYKIPAFDDIPRQFNVSILKGSPNVHAIYSSKAIGEPPLLLASSVFCALKDGIMAARKEVGLTQVFRLDSPATAEKIRNACLDHFTQKIDENTRDSRKKPWSITV